MRILDFNAKASILFVLMMQSSRAPFLSSQEARWQHYLRSSFQVWTIGSAMVQKYENAQQQAWQVGGAHFQCRGGNTLPLHRVFWGARSSCAESAGAGALACNSFSWKHWGQWEQSFWTEQYDECHYSKSRSRLHAELLHQKGWLLSARGELASQRQNWHTSEPTRDRQLFARATAKVCFSSLILSLLLWLTCTDVACSPSKLTVLIVRLSKKEAFCVTAMVVQASQVCDTYPQKRKRGKKFSHNFLNLLFL